MQGRIERIVVTGGAGFIGSHLVGRLLSDEAQQVILIDDFSKGRFTNLDRHLNHNRLTIVQADVRDQDAVMNAIEGATLVVHLAARVAPEGDERASEDVFTTNVVGTFNVLRAASRHQVRRIVFASSYEAYGVPICQPVDEDHPLHAVELNGASKVSGEAYCRAFRRVFGLQTAILRFSDVYGPRDSTGLVARWTEDAQQGRDLFIADKDQVCDFVWIDDVVEAIVRAASTDTLLPPINVASGTGTRLVDVARRVVRLARNQTRVRISSSESSEPRRFVANVERMRRILGIEPPLDPLGHLESLPTSHSLAVAS